MLLLVSLCNFSRRQGRVRPDGGKESCLTKDVLFLRIPNQRDGLFRESAELGAAIQLSAHGIWQAACGVPVS